MHIGSNQILIKNTVECIYFQSHIQILIKNLVECIYFQSHIQLYQVLHIYLIFTISLCN